MLSAVQHQQFVVPEMSNDNSRSIRNDKNFRTTEVMEDNEDFHFLGQHLNTSGLLLLQDEEEEEEEIAVEEYSNTPNNFEIANRAFYATINKFTRQSCSDASKRRSPPYSFLENWHLHSIYSKSQQTLLGITPVRPAVLLSGDDFMFTPPFVQQEDEEEYNDEYMMTDEEEEDVLDWDKNEGDATEFYHLSPCPDTNGLLYIEEEEEDNEDSREYDYPHHRLFRQDITTSSPTNLLSLETTSTSLNSDNTTATNKQHTQYNDGHDYFNTFNHHHHTQENIWIDNERLAPHHHQLSIHIQPNDDLLIMQQSDQEQQSSMMNGHIIDIHADDLYISDSSSSDEQDDDLSSYDITNLYDNYKQQDISSQPILTRSSSILSQKSEEASISSSVLSYQSLADIINKNNGVTTAPLLSSSSIPDFNQSDIIEDTNQPTVSTTTFNNYGSTIAAQIEVHQSSVFDSFKETVETAMNLVYFNLFDNYATYYGANVGNDSNHDVELGTQQQANTTPRNLFVRSFVYILYIWKLLMLSVESFVKRVGMSVLFSRNNEEREPLLT